ncbi:MAG: glycoside hydrolase family 16 protein, partial [Planctomycetota bacterium]
MRTINSNSRLVYTCIALCCATNVSVGVVWDTVVFRDDFDSSPGQPDPEKWIINHPECIWPQCTQWLQGRTRFPNPTPWLANDEFPIIEDGVLVIRHHLFDPYDSGGANETFLGGEVHTRLEFKPDRPYRFEARVKLDSKMPNGLVTSFFSYGYDCSNSDEIDFEFLSNKTNDDTTYPDGDPVLTNSWNESNQCPLYVFPVALDLTAWNTFWIYWYPQPNANCPNGGCVVWSWLNSVNDEILLRTEVAVSCVPDEPMALYFNFWAPCYT